jgi:hypothetical protein
MKTNFTEKDYNLAKSEDYLECVCYNCNNTFAVIKKEITRSYKHNLDINKFCSNSCSAIYNQNKKVEVECSNCLTKFHKKPCDIKRSKNHFCSKSCSATYNNKNKTHGNRRSKLEIWLEKQLDTQCPDLKIDYNQKDAIGSELDIYIPSLKLAFELNGIFHYEPIYGNKKLDQIIENDSNKFQKCIEHNISLCVIDTSQQKYFKVSTSHIFLSIITNIIDKHLLTS